MSTKPEIKFMSLNVNGLGDPVKRARVMAKLRKEKSQINFLQETHLSRSEHEKLKKFGYKHTYYSSHTNTRKRGVAILISNQVRFEYQKEIRDNEGRFVIVKGTIDETKVTLVNIYAPPESDKTFFKMLHDTIALEADGVCWCAGDQNVVIDYCLDTTSNNRSKTSLSKLVKNSWEEMGYIDVWRDLHPLRRDYTHYSHAHSVYSRIDYFYTQKENIELIRDCQIGVADVSDHSAVYMRACLSDRQRNTIWRLNTGLLNSNQVVEQIRTDIGNYLKENDNGETNPAILWDALKAVIRGKLIAISSKLKKEKLANYKQLTSELKIMEQKHKLKADRQTQASISEIRKKINELLQQEVEIKARYLKQNYYESGPKAARLLARRLRKQQADMAIHKIVDPKTKQVKYKSGEIENVFSNYYKDLYAKTSTSSEEDIRLFLGGLDLPTIGTVQNEEMVKNITMEEIGEAIGKSKTNKAPGSDGFPSEMYKKYEKELTPLLHSTFNWVKENNITPPSWKEAIITVIPKPLKDKQHCQNFRPISMLNVDYKLYTSILSKRLQSFIPCLVDEDQCGFVTARMTQDNIRRTLHVMHRINKNKTPAALVSLDAAAAFDRVSWDFLFLTLERFGFEEKAIQCIKTLYTKPTARIKINGSLTDRFELERGTRQGCNLSPTLFAIFIEPLAQMVRQNEAIAGIEINDQQHVISLFADDVMVYLKNPSVTFEPLMQSLDQFGSYSGYELNKSKTQVLMLNCKPNQRLKETGLNWEAKSIRYLGINITKNLTKLYKSNYGEIDENLRKDIDRWSTYPMGLSDRIYTVKMNVLPRLLYLFLSLPVPIPPEQFFKWDKLISRFIWDGKKPRVKYSTLQLTKRKGGMALPNLKKYFQAAQLRPLLSWCSSAYEARWKDIEAPVSAFPIQTIIGERKIPENIEFASEIDMITTYTLNTWHSVVRQLRVGRELGLLKWIAHDVAFKPGRLDPRFKQWTQVGVTAMCSLILKGKMKSFQEMKNEYGLANQDLFRYLQLRDYYCKEVKRAEDDIHPIIKLFSRAYGEVTPRAVSKLYMCLIELNKDSTVYVKNKWEKELAVDISDEMWYDMWVIHQTTTQSSGWREFSWKNQIRYFITPRIKSKQLKAPQPCWRQCDQIDPDHTHVFWSCSKIQPFWEAVHSVICVVLGYGIPSSCLVLYLGHMGGVVCPRDQYLVKIFLVAGKKAITRNWLKTDIPDYEQWRTIVDNIQDMEYLSFKLKIQEDLFQKRWEKWLLYKSKRGEK